MVSNDRKFSTYIYSETRSFKLYKREKKCKINKFTCKRGRKGCRPVARRLVARLKAAGGFAEKVWFGLVEFAAAARRSKTKQKKNSIGLMAGLPIDPNERFGFIWYD